MKWHQHFSTLLETLTTWGNTMDPWKKKKNKQHSDQLGAKKELDDESLKFIKVMFSIWQWQRKTSLSINWWTSIHIIAGAMLFKDNPWSRALQQQLMSNAALERYFHIFILGYPVKHGYDSGQMLSDECIWMNIEHMHTTKIDYGTIYSEAQMRTSPHEYGW